MLNCSKRLRKELNNLEKNKDEQINLYVSDEVHFYLTLFSSFLYLFFFSYSSFLFFLSLFFLTLFMFLKNNIRQWGAIISGPPDTSYYGYKFELKIDVGDEYPMAPPVIRFVTKCFHPNIHFEVYII